MASFLCSNCRKPYPEIGFPHRCPHCDGVFAFDGEINYLEKEVEIDRPGIWRYRHTFSLSGLAPILSLGEGNTPLLSANAFGRQVHFKLEFLNPSGSYKDRATALLVSELLARGVEKAVEDSSGNAGASFAAYSARAGIAARVFVPDYSLRPKRAQIEAYGAQLVLVPGPRSAAAKAARQAAEEGAVYASHALLPFGLAGIATIAFELFEQLGVAPGTLIAPVGHGSLLLGISKGFEALKAAGILNTSPQLVAVQARACAPLWAQSTMTGSTFTHISEGETLAEGVRVSQPVRGEELLQSVAASRGTFLAVEEEDILPGRDALAQLGFYVEPTSAIVWNALEQLPEDSREPIVLLLSGSGLKFGSELIR